MDNTLKVSIFSLVSSTIISALMVLFCNPPEWVVIVSLTIWGINFVATIELNG